MSVFDVAKNVTPPATSKGENTHETNKAEDTREIEPDDFKVIHVSQSRMDKLSGIKGFLTYTRPSTKELFIVWGLPKPIRDIALGVDRKRMRDGIKGPGMRANSVFDFYEELKRIERGPQLIPPDNERMPKLPPVPSLQVPSVFRTPPLPGRVHGGAAAFTPSHPNVSDYIGRAARPMQRRF